VYEQQGRREEAQEMLSRIAQVRGSGGGHKNV
jgi:hypothetical protein